MPRNMNSLGAARQARKQDATLDYLTAPDRPLDALKTDGREILGEHSTLFRGRYRAKTDTIIEKVEKAEDKAGIPGVREHYLTYRNNRTDIKIARLEEKLKQSSGSFLARQIDRQRIQKIENLKFSKKVRTNQGGKLEKKRMMKPEELQRQIDRIVDKKIKAMHRKAERKILKEEHNIARHDFVKRAEFLATLSKDDKQKIVREAILLVRKKNIATGMLDTSHEVDETLPARKIGDDYGRTIE